MSDDTVSLFSLMDSHLSKLDPSSSGNNGSDTFRSASNCLLPAPAGPRLAIPKFFPGNSPMKDFLAEQIANTLKAKEKRKQEEEQHKIEEELRILKIRQHEENNMEDNIMKLRIIEDDNEEMKHPSNENQEDQEYIIDLTSAIIHKPNPISDAKYPIAEEKSIKIGQKPKVKQMQIPALPLRFDKETCLYKPWNPSLPCTTDMSYILQKKIKRAKCSTFGKVLGSRVRPIINITAPYFIEKYDSNIVRFDFQSKSPGDIYRENLLKPKMSTRWTHSDIMDIM